jgi:hypothetical protein
MDLVYELFTLGTNPDPSVSEGSLDLVALLFRTNSEFCQNINRMKFFVAMSISRLVKFETPTHGATTVGAEMDAIHAVDYKKVRKQLNILLEKFSDDELVLKEAITETVQRLMNVVKDFELTEKYKSDPETLVDLYYQISNGFSDSLELRIVWLHRVYSEQVKVSVTFFF